MNTQNRRRPPLIVMWLVRYPARVAAVVAAAIVLTVAASAVVGDGGGDTPKGGTEAAQAGQDGTPEQQCAAAASRFARVYFDRDSPRPEWVEAMRDTTTPDVGRVVGTIDRGKIPAWTPKGVEVVTQEGSCDAKVTFAEGDASAMLLDVEPALGGWRVADWGQS